MTYIPDLTSEYGESGRVLGVGWLEQGKPYQKGKVEEAVFARLMELLRDPWQPYVAAGVHVCDLCRFMDAPPYVQYRNLRIGTGHNNNLFLPGEGVIYIAPSMIVHYIVAHDYAPPDVFCDAVMRCPPMRSMEYWKAILKNSPPEFKNYFVLPRKSNMEES